jgi:hypothetical protein
MGESVPHTAEQDGEQAAPDRIAARLAWILPLLFVPAHVAVALASWNPIAWPPLLFETMAALIAGLACGWRAWRSGGSARRGWVAVAVAMLCWTAGVGSQFIGSLTDAGASGSGAISMLLFVLYGVPLTFVLASPGDDPWRARVVDGALALMLGVLFGAFIFSFVGLAGADDAGALTLAWTFDIQNAFIAVFALIRFGASSIERERRLFAALTAYALAYMGVAAFYNHFIDDVAYGVLASPMIGVPFLLLAALALGLVAAVARPPAPLRARLRRRRRTSS